MTTLKRERATVNCCAPAATSSAPLEPESVSWSAAASPVIVSVPSFTLTVVAAKAEAGSATAGRQREEDSGEHRGIVAAAPPREYRGIPCTAPLRGRGYRGPGRS